MSSIYIDIKALDLVSLNDKKKIESNLHLTRNPAKSLAHLDEAAHKLIVQNSHIRHAKYASFTANAGSLVTSLALTKVNTNNRRLAVIVVGGTSHYDVNWDFSQRALHAGSNLINPLAFPNTLPSAAAVSIASTIGAHGPALTIGDGEVAFADALHVSKLLIRHNNIDLVIIVSTFNIGKVLRIRGTKIAWFHHPIDFVSCTLVSNSILTSASVKLISDPEVLRFEKQNDANKTKQAMSYATGQIKLNKKTTPELRNYYLGSASLAFTTLEAAYMLNTN